MNTRRNAAGDRPVGALSKSKLMAFRQCPKRLWLELHRPELCEESDSTVASFRVGHEVGDIARRLYDAQGRGELIDVQRDGFVAALNRSATLMASSRPIFEAGFSAGGALAFADVMLPVRKTGVAGWRMIEVKSSTSVKDYHRDDAAVQAFVARGAGVRLHSVCVAHIDSSWTYPGDSRYQGLLKEDDLTEASFRRHSEVASWIAGAQSVAVSEHEPAMKMGRHCGDPYECGFRNYCQGQRPAAQYPVEWLPRVQTKALRAHLEADGVIDLRHVPDSLLNEQQQRVKTHTLSGKAYFDSRGAVAALSEHSLPAYFMDFETAFFAVPLWKGTRPYQQIPFQFSVQRLSRTGKLEPTSFLDLSGHDPSRRFAEALIAACGARGAIFVYNAGFESTRLKELGDRFPDLKHALLAISDRIVDLLPIARDHFYHPDQHGSWSIKQVLPTVAPELSYATLEGVQDGGMAMAAFSEALAPATTAARKSQIERQLLEYCSMDTYAMVRLWKFFSGSGMLI